MGRDPRELDGAWVRFQRLEQVEPGPGVAAFVAHFWAARWDYAEPYRQKIVPFPHVHVTVRPGEAPDVRGVSTHPVVRVLEGAGRVAGAAFRPGVLRGVLGRPVDEITDRTVPSTDVPGLPGLPDTADVAGLERWLRTVLPAEGPSPAGREAAAAVARVASDRSIVRVDQLARTAGTSVRRLQRLFAEHVGVGPKWVIRRYRLHEVTERLAAGDAIDWAGLAADLGFADQAHLSRDVADLVGEPPTAYARRYPGRGGART